MPVFPPLEAVRGPGRSTDPVACPGPGAYPEPAPTPSALPAPSQLASLVRYFPEKHALQNESNFGSPTASPSPSSER